MATLFIISFFGFSIFLFPIALGILSALFTWITGGFNK